MHISPSLWSLFPSPTVLMKAQKELPLCSPVDCRVVKHGGAFAAGGAGVLEGKAAKRRGGYRGLEIYDVRQLAVLGLRGGGLDVGSQEVAAGFKADGAACAIAS